MIPMPLVQAASYRSHPAFQRTLQDPIHYGTLRFPKTTSCLTRRDICTKTFTLVLLHVLARPSAFFGQFLATPVEHHAIELCLTMRSNLDDATSPRARGATFYLKGRTPYTCGRKRSRMCNTLYMHNCDNPKDRQKIQPIV